MIGLKNESIFQIVYAFGLILAIFCLWDVRK